MTINYISVFNFHFVEPYLDELHSFINFQHCIDIFLRFQTACQEDFFRNICWRNLHAFLHVNPMDAVTEKDLQRIYECMYQMSVQEIDKILKKVKQWNICFENSHLATTLPSTIISDLLRNQAFYSLTPETQNNFLKYIRNCCAESEFIFYDNVYSHW